MTIIDRTGNVPDGLAFKAPCIVGTTANITLSGLQTIDGVVLIENQRVLVFNQTDQTENGIYQASSGAWTRPNDANSNTSFIAGTQVMVTRGALNGFQTFSVTCLDDPIEIGTSELTFAGTGSLALIANSRLADMPAKTIKSNGGGSAAAPSDNLLSTILDWLTMTVGSILYRGALGWQSLGPGTVNQVLTSQGAGAAPVWGSGTASGASITDPFVEHGHFGGV